MEAKKLLDQTKLVFVSNRGPVSFAEAAGRIVSRAGHGGLVTGLRDVVLDQRAVWISSAMTAADDTVARSHSYGAFDHSVGDAMFRLRLVPSDPAIYARFYEGFANGVLWPLQHYLFDLLRLGDTGAWEDDYGAYRTINAGFAEAVIEELTDQPEAVVMIQDYHHYPCAGLIRSHRPDVFLSQFVHIPWTQPDSWRILPTWIREDLLRGVLANDIVGFHTQRWANNFLACCEELLDGVEVDRRQAVVRHGDRETWARVYPLPISVRWWQQVARGPEAEALAAELRASRQSRRLVVRVDRADPAKNILRGVEAFDLFLREHRHYRERVVFLMHLVPSRLTAPGYAEYLETVKEAVATLNRAHGMPGWTPVELVLTESVHRAAAEYREADVFISNSLMDGRNLVALEASLLNTVGGVLVLSENAGAYEALGEHALAVNPWDVGQQAAAIHKALEMSMSERNRRARALRRAASNERSWFDAQWADYLAKRGLR